MGICHQDHQNHQNHPYQDHPLIIKVESHGISWTLVESHPVTIKVGVLSKSTSYNNKVSESTS
jgi:hypothetical protein